ncbi:MAG: oligosaccharide flippase family protein, partial [Dysgonamonadaceae bacterium]|nr:oligosaccharide flippase family protein [Dysgonamonadaceae bacterium]
MTASNKVIYNTGILYLRMVLTAGISLYTTRVLLEQLGVSDYGIYNLVSGVVAMLSFLNTAMTTSTQRYLSFSQGKGDVEMQKNVFSESLRLHFFVGIVIVIFLEIAGLFLFGGFLNIPEERMLTAKAIYHFLAVSVFFTVLAVPYTAALTARENMLWIAIVNTAETLLRLVATLLLFIATGDKLIYFGLYSALITVVSFVLYVVYCTKKYRECHFDNRSRKKDLLKELSSFAGWNIFGALCGTARMQGLAVILNLFFGTVINAAYGVANQLSLQLNFFSATLLRTINPQIMKSEGANNRQRMLRLSMIAGKFSFFLLAVFAIPCIFEMPRLLIFWLKEVPEYTAVFCSLILVTILINQLTVGLQSSFQAIGKIKVYQLLVGTLLLLNLPIAYFLLKAGNPPYIVLVSYLLIESSACVMRLLLAKKMAGLSIREYF